MFYLLVDLYTAGSLAAIYTLCTESLSSITSFMWLH